MNAPELSPLKAHSPAAAGQSLQHDSARAQVCGSAPYVDDIPELKGTLYAAPILSTVAHGRLKGVDASAAMDLPGVRGVFTAADVKAVLRPADQHFAPTKLVCIENTHNRGGGSVWPLQRIREVAEVSRARGLRLHLDGARLWNAAVATGIPERDYAAHFDSVSVCFSKGLGAPVGSALCGTREFIQRARRFRKMYGGGMRQAGILAAGALHALEHHRARLAEDHANARALAEGLSRLPGIDLDPASVQTNIVLMHVTKLPAATLVGALDQAGVRVLATGPDAIRAVTNLMVSSQQIDAALEIFERILGNIR